MSEEVISRIQSLALQGKSANAIQATLQSEGMGIRRSDLLKYVRQAKGVRVKEARWKYTPRKYREGAKYQRWGKRIAVYGKVKGKSRRVEISGKGKDIYKSLRSIMKHPPKKRVLRIDADRFDGREDLDLDEEWDDRPELAS